MSVGSQEWLKCFRPMVADIVNNQEDLLEGCQDAIKEHPERLGIEFIGFLEDESRFILYGYCTVELALPFARMPFDRESLASTCPALPRGSLLLETDFVFEEDDGPIGLGFFLIRG
nr:hypothetical protein [Candidatus Sigynarchaeota archaeon]